MTQGIRTHSSIESESIAKVRQCYQHNMAAYISEECSCYILSEISQLLNVMLDLQQDIYGISIA